MGCATKTIASHTEKKWHSCIQECEFWPILEFSTHTYVCVLGVILGISSPYFAVSLVCYHAIGGGITRWCVITKKIDAAPVFVVSRINVKLRHCSRDLKIGLASFFVCSHTNGRYTPLLHNKILDCLWNMGAELPLFRIFHANPCMCKTHPKMTCILREHGFGC